MSGRKRRSNLFMDRKTSQPLSSEGDRTSQICASRIDGRLRYESGSLNETVMADSPLLSAEYNYQKTFRNLLSYANVSNCLSILFGYQIFARKRKLRKVFCYLYSADVIRGTGHCESTL